MVASSVPCNSDKAFLYLNRVKIVSPVILHMIFFEAVVDIVYETSGHIISQSNGNDIPAACFATRPKPPGWRRDGEWTGGSREGGRRRGREEEVRQGTEEEGRQSPLKEEGKEGGREAGRRKRESAPPTKLKSRGCNSSDLETKLLITEHREGRV